ncbi:MAG: aminopeptidase N C-terminal domain-containing protein, partial [Janthinobacterium sp.]
EAGQQLSVQVLQELIAQHQQGSALVLDQRLVTALGTVLANEQLDQAMVAEMLSLPSEAYLTEISEVADVDAIHAAREFARKQIADQLFDALNARYQANRGLSRSTGYVAEAEHFARRSLQNIALSYLMLSGKSEVLAATLEQFDACDNMTERLTALAVLVKYDIYSALVGTQYTHLPTWVSYWANVDKLSPLISIVDVNRDGIVQLAEISIDADVLVLATPEIAGLPYVISGLVAAGGLAAALSTADGLLLAISNALSHDIYYKVVDPSASTQKRVTISKLLLLAVAFIAAYAASQKPADILSLVGVAFSLAASTLFPPLVLGVFWQRANYQGALAGMLTGFGVCLYYMLHTSTMLGGNASGQWFHIAPISAGIFGVPAGLATAVLVSWLTPAPGRRSTGLVEHIRAPE